MNPTIDKKDYLLIISFFTIILLSGAIQLFNIFYLATLNIVVLFFLYKKIGFIFHSKIKKVIIFLIIYFFYSFIISLNTESYIHIIYRFHDLITATLFINYLLIRNKSIDKEINFVFKTILYYGTISFVISNLFFQFYLPVKELTATIYDDDLMHRFLIFFASNKTKFGIYRAQAFFWEPGVYQIYLNVMLYYYLLVKSNSEKWITILIITAIISTLSTTGLLIFTFTFTYYILKKTRKSIWSILSLVIYLPIIFYYIQFAENIIIEKFQGDSIGSSEARRYDALNSFNVIYDNPLGIGFDPMTYQSIAKKNPYNIVTFLNTDRGSTNGVLILFVSTGVFFGVFFIFLLYNQKIFPKNRKLVFIITFLSIIGEPLFFSPFILIFCLSSLIKSNELLKIKYV